jgi:hypothetical protein
MADWRDEDEEQDQYQWPVQYPAETPSQAPSGRFRQSTPPRWAGMEKVGSGELRKRLLWLLLAVEIGMALAAACVLPLAFLKLPVREEGVVGATLTEVGRWLGISSQAACLILALPIPILVLTLGLNLWLVRRVGQRKRD